MLTALAILPGLLISYYIYYKDKHDKEPSKYLLACFFFGILSIFPAIMMEEYGISLGFDESPNILITAIFAFLVVGFSEEFCKFVVLRFYIFPKDAFNEPIDGIVYAVMISMGFATIENVYYAMDYGMPTTIMRAFTAVPAHAAFAVLMGYYTGMARFDKKRSFSLLFKGLASAVFLHGLYDFFLMQQNFPALTLLAFVSLGIGIHLSRKLIKAHQQASPFIEVPGIVPEVDDNQAFSDTDDDAIV